jgi:two-component system cell cycle response regulator DivK
MIILVVDDHADSRETVKAALEMSGHLVIEAANGSEAIDVATVSVPDVILMDLSMPVMDGLAATRILRSRPETSTVRIVAVSANGHDATSRAAALLSGCDAYYGKPIDFGSLSKMLNDTAR